MPELPEVEAVCRKVRHGAAKKRVIQLRIVRPSIVRPQKPRQLETAVEGAILRAVERRGKNILLFFDNDVALHIHLRMTGNLYVIPDVRLRPATARAWMELEGGRGLIFDDPRALGRIRLLKGDEIEETFSGVGIEPLSKEFTLDSFLEKASKSRQPAKLFLMDQRHIAGLGNIYAAESLYRARMNPKTPIHKYRRAKLSVLHQSIQEVLNEALHSATAAYAEPGRFSEAEFFDCAVYGREGEPCRRCGRKIRRIAQGGRSTYFCPSCQR